MSDEQEKEDSRGSNRGKKRTKRGRTSLDITTSAEGDGRPVPRSTPSTFGTQQLWVDRYTPTASADLAVHKKKVSEIRTWIDTSEADLRTRHPLARRLLVLAGPPGSGKSTVIRILAAEKGMDVREWIPRERMSWNDVKKGGDTMVPYVSRIADLEEFLARSSRHGGLESPRGQLVLLEELPFQGNQEQANRTRDALLSFIQRTRFPAVLIVSEAGGTSASAANPTFFVPREILDSPLVSRINLNPVALTLLYKVLYNIASAQRLTTTKEQLQAIAAASGGDVRQAIHSLQFASRIPLAKASVTEIISCGGRDVTLGLQHAVGKILHHKFASTQTGRHLADGFDPEGIVERSGADPSTFTAFMHQNYPHFFMEVEDVADALDALSTVDTFPGQGDRIGDIAESVACRGMLLANAHPAPSRWQAIYKPEMFLAYRRARENSRNASQCAVDLSSGDVQSLSACHILERELCSEVMAYARRILLFPPPPPHLPAQPPSDGSRHAELVWYLGAYSHPRAAHHTSAVEVERALVDAAPLPEDESDPP